MQGVDGAAQIRAVTLSFSDGTTQQVSGLRSVCTCRLTAGMRAGTRFLSG